MYESNEDFLRELEISHPGVDWDNLPDLDTYPNVYIVEGMQHRRLHFYAQEARAGNNWTASNEKDDRDQIGIGFGEQPSLEAAEKLLAKILDPNSEWQQERFDHRYSSTIDGVEIVWSDEYFGPVINETIKIRINKPWDALSLNFLASMRKQVLEKPEEQIFPMYFP
jgi:hypothetical protein